MVSLAVLGLVALARPVEAAPPVDLPTFCRSVEAQLQFQVRCLFTERSAQARLNRSRASVAPDAWSRCESSSGSWSAMESCLGTQGPRGGIGAGGNATPAAGAAAAPGGADDQGDRRPGPDTGSAAGGTSGAPTAPDPAGASSAAGTRDSSTVILGPRESAPSAAEPNRVTRPVTEAEAQRQLEGVLERSGTAARCTKKQYGPGWVTVCE